MNKSPYAALIFLAERDLGEYQTFLYRQLSTSEGIRLDTLHERLNMFVDQAHAEPRLYTDAALFLEKLKAVWKQT